MPANPNGRPPNKAVMRRLLSHIEKHDGIQARTAVAMSAQFGVSRRSLSRWLQELVDSGIVEGHSGRFRPTADFDVNFPLWEALRPQKKPANSNPLKKPRRKGRMVGAWEAIVRKMPPLRHKVGEEYDPKTSEVFQWLLSDQKIQTKILQTLIGPDHEPRLVYNSATGTWQGVDFKNFEPAAQEEVVDL